MKIVTNNILRQLQSETMGHGDNWRWISGCSAAKLLSNEYSAAVS
ncbi:MAG: hypothetical protein KBONHNOK_00529 [Candidatus Methanoperedenaceae archaeon GB50]|nr:MAG: hypothetical protein KBONHNOK_00529 [Candidatus Methanoperedenaceae archaeon GB50]